MPAPPASFGAFCGLRGRTLKPKKEPEWGIGDAASAVEEYQDKLMKIVNEQAEDFGLWFTAETASEAYLQRALRRLHAAIENKG